MVQKRSIPQESVGSLLRVGIFFFNRVYLMLVIWSCVFQLFCYVIIINTGSDIYGQSYTSKQSAAYVSFMVKFNRSRTYLDIF